VNMCSPSICKWCAALILPSAPCCLNLQAFEVTAKAAFPVVDLFSLDDDALDAALDAGAVIEDREDREVRLAAAARELRSAALL
jgi:hypothetical protein